jgi:hypothetical protein
MSERLVDVAARLLYEAEGKPFMFAASAAMMDRLKAEFEDEAARAGFRRTVPDGHVMTLFGVPVRQATRMPHRDDYFALLCDA